MTNNSSDNRDVKDQTPPPSFVFAAYAVGSAATVFALYLLWKWIVCGCLGI